MFDWLKKMLPAEREKRLYPESAYVVTMSDTEVSCSSPDGAVESVAWDDLHLVIIETTDLGPFATDVFWVLIGRQSRCVIPQGATGEEELLHKLQDLPDFDNNALIEAMTSTSNRQFLCWKKD